MSHQRVMATTLWIQHLLYLCFLSNSECLGRFKFHAQWIALQPLKCSARHYSGCLAGSFTKICGSLWLPCSMFDTGLILFDTGIPPFDTGSLHFLLVVVEFTNIVPECGRVLCNWLFNKVFVQFISVSICTVHFCNARERSHCICGSCWINQHRC